MKLLLSLLFVVAGIVGLSAADINPKIEICRYKDDKKAAVSLTFDDASYDHLTHAVPLLEKYGYRGTFYVIIKRVPVKHDGKKLTWNEIKQVAASGHEIGNHSMSHYQLTKAKSMDNVKDEILSPLPIFKEKIGIMPETFCYPGNSRNKEIVAIAESVHVGSTNCGRAFYGQETFDLKTQEKWLDNAIAERTEHVAMFHGIVPGGGWKPFRDVAVFEQILKNIKARDKDLWVCTFADMCKYRKLYNSSKIEKYGNDSFQIVSQEKLAFPLTVKISPCPKQARQNGKALAVSSNKDYGLVSVVPEAGSVKLSY
jgi:peptidoglycan/xylan/chitin deacetylase (PgdA/CDA1 family)